MSLAVRDFDREIDATIDELPEALEVGKERLGPGHFVGANIARSAAHVVRVAELPVGAGFGCRILILLAERAGAHGSDPSELGLGSGELGLPSGELLVLHSFSLNKAVLPRAAAKAAGTGWMERSAISQ